MCNKDLIGNMVIVDFQETENRAQVENSFKNIGILKYLGFTDEEINKASHDSLIDVYEMVESLGYSIQDGKIVQVV